MIHCLHGAVGSFQAWERLCQDLDKSTNAIDLWRFFDQSKPSLAEAGHLISELAGSGDILLGYSMGGRLALHALLADPKKWKAAIIISAHPGLITEREERQKIDQKWALLSKRNWASFLHLWNNQDILAASSQELHQADIEDQDSVSQSFLHWSLGNQKNLRQDLPKITCPVLWVTGGNDQKFTAFAKEATTLLPNSEHLIIPESGHRVPWDHPEEFCKSVQAFLKHNLSP